jgi:hypothetical protein
MLYCSICYSTNTDEDMVCESCDEYYCEDCSYTFSIHYQFQGAKCYVCADQRRRTPLSKELKRNNKIKIIDKNS